ncbi:MAG: hypothetical protein IJT77_06045 [Clostridia bacterium]|nr:hypothetical protein [Clostridia bacterium]
MENDFYQFPEVAAGFCSYADTCLPAYALSRMCKDREKLLNSGQPVHLTKRHHSQIRTSPMSYIVERILHAASVILSIFP